jgi:predicted RNase H-like HicB family nuclease
MDSVTMLQEFHIIIEQDDEGCYVASVPALAGCHTQAQSLDELMERVREAIGLCLETEESPVGSRPLRFVGVQRLTVDA